MIVHDFVDVAQIAAIYLVVMLYVKTQQKVLLNLKDQMAFLCKVPRSFRTALSHCLLDADIMNSN